MNAWRNRLFLPLPPRVMTDLSPLKEIQNSIFCSWLALYLNLTDGVRQERHG